MLHRPTSSSSASRPSNCDDLLFDDVLWVKRARQEHDAFADALGDRGVEVLYLGRAARPRRSTIDAARPGCSSARSTEAALGPSSAPRVRE